MSDDELREVWNDVDGARRREFWTDGEWVKVGRDVDDHGLCLTFRVEDDYYDQFRRGDHPSTVSIEDDRGSDNRYLVDRKGMGTFRFFQGDRLVLRVDDHELGTIRAAYRKARELRREEYDYADIAKSHVRGLFPSQLDLEITDCDIRPNKPRGMLSVEHQHETVRINDRFVEAVKDDPHLDWGSVYHDLDEAENGFYYRFTADAESIREGSDDG